MAEQGKTLPRLWSTEEADSVMKSAALSDDAVKDAILYERALYIEKVIAYAVARDMHCRERKGRVLVDFLVERVVRNALDRCVDARKVDADDFDDKVLEELDRTASRVAHDICLTSEGESVGADSDEYLIAYTAAQRVLTDKANRALRRPLVVPFVNGMRREVQLVRSVLSASRRERYAKLESVLRKPA